jgi:hypothetical protein
MINFRMQAKTVTAILAVAVIPGARDVHAQNKLSGLSIAADMHKDVAWMTNFALRRPRGFNDEGRRDAGGGANQLGGGIEIEYESRPSSVWMASIGLTSGTTNAPQDPDLSPYRQHNFTRFTTSSVGLGRRWYLRKADSRIRAYYDGSVGYEWLTADLNYFIFPTDTVVRTSGPMARVRIGSQWKFGERMASEVALQWRIARYGDWKRSGHSIPGSPAKMTSYSIRSAIRVRM